ARGEGMLTVDGALVVDTGEVTGRSPRDRFIVSDPSIDANIAWGGINQPFPAEQFDALLERAMDYLRMRDAFVFEGCAGAHPRDRLPVRVITEFAWHSLFARQLFIRPEPHELANFEPQLTVIDVPGLRADPERDGTRTGTFILLNL